MRHQAVAEPQLTRSDRLWFATILVVIAMVILMIGCSGCAARQTPDGVPTMSDPAVARLVKVTDGKEAGHCTVFKVFGDDLAMTAGHCCDTEEAKEPETIEDLLNQLADPEAKPEKVKVTYHAVGPHAVPGAEFKVLHDDDKHDVCLMRGKLKGAPLLIADTDPTIGNMVWTAGYPKGVFLISSGHWAGRDEDNESVASIAVNGGASGSPVLDSRSRVVGILRAYYPHMSNMAVISPLEWVRHAHSTRK